VRPFLQGNINYVSSKSSGTNYSSTNNGANYFLGGGMAVFINENIALEGLAGYDHTKYKNFDGSGGVKFSIGFQVYLHKAQVDKVSGKK
jgi:hypothetical protein